MEIEHEEYVYDQKVCPICKCSSVHDLSTDDRVCVTTLTVILGM